ncbi:hypothetical protein ACIVBQ_002265 [Tenacibaculum discolor]
MIKIKTTLNILLLLLTTVVFSQAQLNLTKLTGSYDNGSFSEFSSSKEINGTPYLFENWNNLSIITLTNGKEYKLNNINFDIKKKKFVSKISNKKLFIFENIKKVTIKGKKYIEVNNSFYQKIFYKEKGLSLLKKFKLKEVKPIINKMTYQVIKKGTYKKIEEYFVKKEDKLKEVKLKRSSILKEFSKDLQVKVKKFSKQESLSFKEEGDLFKIFKYYNSL